MESIKINTTAGHPTRIPGETDHPMDATLFFSIPAPQHFFTLHISTVGNSSHLSPPRKGFPRGILGAERLLDTSFPHFQPYRPTQAWANLLGVRRTAHHWQTITALRGCVAPWWKLSLAANSSKLFMVSSSIKWVQQYLPLKVAVRFEPTWWGLSDSRCYWGPTNLHGTMASPSLFPLLKPRAPTNLDYYFPQTLYCCSHRF